MYLYYNKWLELSFYKSSCVNFSQNIRVLRFSFSILINPINSFSLECKISESYNILISFNNYDIKLFYLFSKMVWTNSIIY